MKGCNTLTLCPAQMHEAVEYWLKNQLLSPAQAASVEVTKIKVRVDGGGETFEVSLREVEPPVSVADYINRLPQKSPTDASDGNHPTIHCNRF